MCNNQMLRACPQIMRLYHHLYWFTTETTQSQDSLDIRHHAKQVEAQKPTPIQIRAQRENIMSLRLVRHEYKLLQSSHTDTLDDIKYKYMHLKKQYNDRHFYTPNKERFLRRLDEAYDKIVAMHQDYQVTEINKDKGMQTKDEVITYELERLRQKMLLGFWTSSQAGPLYLLLSLLVLAAYEQYLQKDIARYNLLEGSDEVRQIACILTSYQQRIKKLLGSDRKIVMTKQQELDLQEMGIDYKNSSVFRNFQTSEQFLAQRRTPANRQ